MQTDLPTQLMLDFAERTGLSSSAVPRRYLWTDAFAVCNFLGLHERTGEQRYRELAVALVEQVHHTLGKHRADDARSGWLTGLPESEGAEHPTRAGLRIGKELPERSPDDPYNERLEWQRDGQYFHYLTKWMHALRRAAVCTGEAHYLRWARELAATAHDAFTVRTDAGRGSRMVWKMSIDLSRVLVGSMGQHDPLDALVTSLDLQTSTPSPGEDAGPDLSNAVTDAEEMCSLSHWLTGDALGIGGLLTDAGRVARLVARRGLDRTHLLRRLLSEAHQSLLHFAGSFNPNAPGDFRLAFRELGLAIGLRAAERMPPLLREAPDATEKLAAVLEQLPLAEQIESFWSKPPSREASTWVDHAEINTVMLTAALAPDGYLGLKD